ncbi:MAG TPA: hypothetical protein VK586_23910 [Streptosporangiaceae bacterium]|nr:hypothetical protein [Streptosporangiaceae bacterium]
MSRIGALLMHRGGWRRPDARLAGRAAAVGIGCRAAGQGGRGGVAPDYPRWFSLQRLVRRRVTRVLGP